MDRTTDATVFISRYLCCGEALAREVLAAMLRDPIWERLTWKSLQAVRRERAASGGEDPLWDLSVPPPVDMGGCAP